MHCSKLTDCCPLLVRLTYWGLLNYDHVPAVRVARRAMSKQATAMMMDQYNRNAHVCENYR